MNFAPLIVTLFLFVRSAYALLPHPQLQVHRSETWTSNRLAERGLSNCFGFLDGLEFVVPSFDPLGNTIAKFGDVTFYDLCDPDPECNATNNHMISRMLDTMVKVFTLRRKDSQIVEREKHIMSLVGLFRSHAYEELEGGIDKHYIEMAKPGHLIPERETGLDSKRLEQLRKNAINFYYEHMSVNLKNAPVDAFAYVFDHRHRTWTAVVISWYYGEPFGDVKRKYELLVNQDRLGGIKFKPRKDPSGKQRKGGWF